VIAESSWRQPIYGLHDRSDIDTGKLRSYHHTRRMTRSTGMKCRALLIDQRSTEKSQDRSHADAMAISGFWM